MAPPTGWRVAAGVAVGAVVVAGCCCWGSFGPGCWTEPGFRWRGEAGLGPRVVAGEVAIKPAASCSATGSCRERHEQGGVSALLSIGARGPASNSRRALDDRTAWPGGGPVLLAGSFGGLARLCPFGCLPLCGRSAWRSAAFLAVGRLRGLGLGCLWRPWARQQGTAFLDAVTCLPCCLSGQRTRFTLPCIHITAR